MFPAPERTYALNALVRVGGRFLAFGSAGGPDGYVGAALWMSDDGRQWGRQADPRGVFAGGTVAGATTFDGLVVAAGTARDAAGTNVAAVWTSPDAGSTWVRQDAGNPGFAIGRTTQIFAVGTGGPGVVAVGLTFDGATIQARAWSSADGRTWGRASEPPEWTGPGDHSLDLVCRLPDGTALVMGAAVQHGDGDAMAWVSRDGVTWARAAGAGTEMLAGAGPQFAKSCATLRDRLLVGGGVPGPGGTDGIVWSTADGMSWQRVEGSSAMAGPGDDWVRALAVDGGRVVAMTREGGEVAAYTSPDGGVTWQRRVGAGMRGPGLRSATELVVVGDEVVAAGVDGSSAAVWIGPAL